MASSAAPGTALSLPSAASFFLLNRLAGWRELAPPVGLELGEVLRLQPLPGAGQPLDDPTGSLGGLSLPASLAIDSAARIYLLDGERLLRYDPCSPGFTPLVGIGGQGCHPRQFDHPGGMDISPRDNLYIADSGNRRVQVFALKGLALRWIWGPLRVEQVGGAYRARPVSPSPVPEAGCLPGSEFPPGTWLPSDVAVDVSGRAFVADFDNGLVHVFDRQGRWQSAWDGRDPDGVPLSRPIFLALDKEGQLYIVQQGVSDVTVLDEHGQFVRRVGQPEALKERFVPGPLGIDAQGRLYLGDARTGCLYLYDETQTRAHLCPAPPSRCCAIAFDQAGAPLLADKLTGLVYRLEQETAFTPQGSLVVGPLDSELYRCPWHKIVLEGGLSPGTYVLVETFTSDAPAQLGQVLSLPDDRWATRQAHSTPGDQPWDCLVRSQPGRYLWLRLSLFGDGRHTPVLRAVRVEFPRHSSLGYLPAVYREDPVSADFLDRFLSIADAIWGQIGTVLDHIDWYFDPAATPAASPHPDRPDFLTWLASWLGLALDQNWPEERRRRLVAEAHRLFALRGTPEGLREYVALAAGVEPQIFEHYRLRRWLFLDSAHLGDASVLWGSGVVDRLQLDQYSRIGEFQIQDTGDPQRDPFHLYAHQCTLFVPLRQGGEEAQRRLEQVVDLARPAHVQASIEFVQPRLRIGQQSVVGVNTIIGCYPSGVKTGAGALGYDTVLSPSADEWQAPDFRLGKSSRLGSGTRLD